MLKLFIVTLLVQNLIMIQVWGHNPNDRSVVSMQPVNRGPDANRAGYGWLNSTSEVAAETFFHDLCPQRGGGTMVGACASALQLQDARLGNSLAYPAIESAFVLLAKEKSYEHLAMQAAAMGQPIPPLPTCLAGSESAKKINKFITDNKDKSTTDLGTEIDNLGTSPVSPINRAKVDMLTKLRAVKGSFSPNRVAQALLLDKSLKANQQTMCASATDDDQLACINIKGARDRIRRAFPLIFSLGTSMADDPIVGDEGAFDGLLPDKDACGRSPKHQLERSIYHLMGAFESPANINPLASNCAEITTLTTQSSVLESTACRGIESNDMRRLLCRGAGQVRTNLSNRRGYSQVVSFSGRSPGLWDRSLAALNAVNGTGPAVVPAPSATQSARLLVAGGAFNSAMDALKVKHGRDINLSLKRLCDNSHANLRWLTNLHPQAVQQAILDLPSAAAQQSVKMMMCAMPKPDRPYLEKFQKYNQSFSCRGVTTNADGSTTVKRKSWGWPFAGSVNYNIVTAPDGVQEVQVPVKFTPVCDNYLAGLPVSTGTGANIGQNLPAGDRTRLMGLSDSNKNGVIDVDEFNYFQLTGMNCKAQQTFANNRINGPSGWVTSSNQRWSSQASTVNPPLKPNVRVKILRCCTSGCPNICPAGAKEINVSACYNADSNNSNCNQVTSNREAEENYSFAQNNNTTWHEMGHAMGLQDEYRDPDYPAHALGETGSNSPTGCGSTMGSQTNWSNGSCEQLHRRHYLEIVRPAKLGCGTGGPAAPADS